MVLYRVAIAYDISGTQQYSKNVTKKIEEIMRGKLNKIPGGL